MLDLYPLTGRLLRSLPSETAHAFGLWALRHGLARRPANAADPVLAVELWGRRFGNPLGLAAGFDKNAEVMAPALRLGFGFVEIGTVTPRPQRGNPAPRLFRVRSRQALINRLGFNNAGLAVVAERLRAYRAQPHRPLGPVGVNIGCNRDSEDPVVDYRAGIEALAGLADYLAINVSSPNTPGLRALQGRSALGALLETALDARARSGHATPLLVKIAPDLDDEACAAIAETALGLGVDGLIVSNTTVSRPTDLPLWARAEAGGLSGRPLMQRATDRLRLMAGLTGGRLPLIGAGGVASGADAYEKIRAGASLVQLYTALIYGGPALPGRILEDLTGRLRADGFTSAAEAVNADRRRPASVPKGQAAPMPDAGESPARQPA